MRTLRYVTRWFFAVAVFPLLWAAAAALALFGTLDVVHVAGLAFIVVIAYFTQPVWIWKLAHSADGWERRSRLVQDAPAAAFSALVISGIAWTWVALSRTAQPGDTIPIGSAPGEDWRLAFLAVPFLVVLFGWGFATIREERAPLTLAAALSLPIGAPLLWAGLLLPVTL